MALPMEFWGVEVKAGQPLKVNPGEAKIIHLSQVSLGESKNKGSEPVPVSVKFGGQKLVLGTLSSEHFPQINFDLVFEKEFELSHNWKNGSVFFCGYSTMLQEEDEHSGESDDESSDEDIPLTASGNGNGEAKPSKPDANAAKPESSGKKVTIAEPAKMEVDSEDDDDDSDEDEENDSDDDSEDEDDSDEEDDETPKKVEVGKKRPSGSAVKTPVADKKAKVSTPQKTDGKKGSGHTATPHPKKKDAKTAAAAAKDAGKSKQEQTPGHVTCNTCSKTFKSDGALQSHTKAKHSAAAK